MPINLPSNINVGGRFPLDAKYWADTYANLNDGEIYVGQHKWIKEGEYKDKEFVLLSTGVWREETNGGGEAGTITVGTVTAGQQPRIVNRGTSTDAILDFILPLGPAGQTPIIDIGRITAGTTPSVRNVGTPDRAILDFVLPLGTSGQAGSNGQSIWMAFADNAVGLNPSYSMTGKKFASFVQSVLQPPLTEFNSWLQIAAVDGINGNSVWVAYAQSAGGLNKTFVFNADITHVSYLNRATQPVLSDFSIFVPISGAGAGGGASVEGAFGISTTKGITQAFLTNELQYPATVDKFPGQQIGNLKTSENLKGRSLIYVLDKMMEAPFTLAVASISGGGLYEKGTSVTVNLSYSFTANSEAITARSIYKNGALLASPNTNSGSIEDLGVTTNTPYYSQVAVDGGVRNSGTTYASFIAPSFHGIVTALLPTEDQMKALTKAVTVDNNRPLTFTNNNERVAITYPFELGELTAIRDPSNFNTLPGWTKTIRNHTLANGATESYYLYVLTNPAGDGSAFTFTFIR